MNLRISQINKLDKKFYNIRVSLEAIYDKFQAFYFTYTYFARMLILSHFGPQLIYKSLVNCNDEDRFTSVCIFYGSKRNHSTVLFSVSSHQNFKVRIMWKFAK